MLNLDEIESEVFFHVPGEWLHLRLKYSNRYLARMLQKFECIFP
jgi:hypothetical protein